MAQGMKINELLGVHPVAKPKDLTKLRSQPGKSNAYTYKGIPKKDFAGADETYPVNTKQRYTAALRLLGHAPKSKQAALRSRIIGIGLRKKVITSAEAQKARKS